MNRDQTAPMTDAELLDLYREVTGCEPHEISYDPAEGEALVIADMRAIIGAATNDGGYQAMVEAGWGVACCSSYADEAKARRWAAKIRRRSAGELIEKLFARTAIEHGDGLKGARPEPSRSKHTDAVRR